MQNDDPSPSEPETPQSPIPIAFPFYMAMLVAFLALPLFWPDHLLNRLGMGENFLFGGPLTALLLALTMLLAPILLCLAQMLRK